MTLHGIAACVDSDRPAIALPAPSRTFKKTGTLPEELTNAPQWICWHYVSKGNMKPAKVPCTPTGGPLYKWQENVAQWMTYERAVECYEANPALSGIGFVLTPDLGIVGIDMDDAMSLETGEVAQWAKDHIEDFDAYTEVSPSGKGFRTFVLGTLPDGCPKKVGNREIYNCGRWLTVTGNVWHDAPPQARPEAIARYVAAMMQTTDPRPATDAVRPATGPAAVRRVEVTPQTVAALRSALAHLRADDHAEWVKIGHCLRELGDVGRGLWVDWSRTSEAWRPTDAQKWDGFAADHAGYRGVFTAAQKTGWVNPASNAAKTPLTASVLSTWALDRIGDLLKQPAPTNWLVRGVLESESLACLFGPSGHGKSFIAVDLACSVATGTPWHAHKVKLGAVVYLAGEGHRGLRKRFLAWSIDRGVPLDSASLHLSKSAIDLAGEVDRITNTVRDACATPALVVIDTLHRHLKVGGDENTGADLGPFIAAADAIKSAFGCAVMLVHHVGHVATERERGWSGLRGALDWSYSAQRGDNGPVILQCRKAKDHEPPEPMQFALAKVALPWVDDEGEQETSSVLHLAGSTEGGMGGNQLLALNALRKLAYATKGEPVSSADWRKAAGVDRRRWREVVAALTERGLILQEGDHVRLV